LIVASSARHRELLVPPAGQSRSTGAAGAPVSNLRARCSSTSRSSTTDSADTPCRRRVKTGP